MEKLQSRDREAAWPGLAEQRKTRLEKLQASVEPGAIQTWWRSCSPGTGRQPGQASQSSERLGWRSCRLVFSLVPYKPGGEAAVNGQRGRLARPRRVATDLVEKLQSRDREAAKPGLG